MVPEGTTTFKDLDEVGKEETWYLRPTSVPHRGAAMEEPRDEAKQETPLEDLAEQHATKAAAAAKGTSALLAQPGPHGWTTASIRNAAAEEMNAILAKEGISKDDIIELCSSGSRGTYADIWAENQGKHCSPWVPSLSASIAVSAGVLIDGYSLTVLSREDQLQEDRHSASAVPRVLISSKVVFPTAATDSKKQTRFASPPVTRRPRLGSHVSLLTPRCSGLRTGSSALHRRRSTRSWQRTLGKKSSPPLSTWRWAKPWRTNRGCAAI
jgi:hypothetical protein